MRPVDIVCTDLELSHSVIQRFWAKIVKGDAANSCWSWTASRNASGYGEIGVYRVNVLAHRLSWKIHFGPLPIDACVLHRCDNPQCSRPDHLFLGTRADNSADMVSKGRQCYGDRHPFRRGTKRAASGDANGARTRPDRVARGEKSGTHKLTTAAVLEIRSARERGQTLNALAMKYGVSRAGIGKVVNGITWRHLLTQDEM